MIECGVNQSPIICELFYTKIEFLRNSKLWSLHNYPSLRKFQFHLMSNLWFSSVLTGNASDG